jgi:hypothetical protein
MGTHHRDAGAHCRHGGNEGLSTKGEHFWRIGMSRGADFMVQIAMRLPRFDLVFLAKRGIFFGAKLWMQYVLHL